MDIAVALVAHGTSLGPAFVLVKNKLMLEAGFLFVLNMTSFVYVLQRTFDVDPLSGDPLAEPTLFGGMTNAQFDRLISYFFAASFAGLVVLALRFDDRRIDYSLHAIWMCCAYVATEVFSHQTAPRYYTRDNMRWVRSADGTSVVAYHKDQFSASGHLLQDGEWEVQHVHYTHVVMKPIQAARAAWLLMLGVFLLCSPVYSHFGMRGLRRHIWLLLPWCAVAVINYSSILPVDRLWYGISFIMSNAVTFVSLRVVAPDRKWLEEEDELAAQGGISISVREIRGGGRGSQMEQR